MRPLKPGNLYTLQAEVLPGFRGGYVPAAFDGGHISDGIVLLEVERQMWAPLYSARKRNQRLLGAAITLAVRTKLGADSAHHT